MGSPFIFELKLWWSKNKKSDSDLITIYAFKSGGESSLWQSKVDTLNDLEQIIKGSDGARMLTVATFAGIAGRTLENSSISKFSLFVRDVRIKDGNKGKIVANIVCDNMTGGKKFPVGNKFFNMSNESLDKDLVKMMYGVSLDFHDTDGGPVFTRL